MADGAESRAKPLDVSATDRQSLEKRRLRLTRRRFGAYVIPYLYLLPALVFISVFFVLPVLFSGYLSVLNWDMISPQRTFVGLHNYLRALQDPVFQMATKNTLLYALGTVPTSIVLGLGLAVLVESTTRAREIYRFVFFVPTVTSMSVVALVWILLYSPKLGLVNQGLGLLGIGGPDWLNDPKWALGALMVVGVWKGFGYNMVLFIAGLKNIDRELYEAASIDGASSWQRFRRITLPLLSPVTLFVTILMLISSFQVFASIQIMTEGGPNNATNVLVYKIWQEAFKFFDAGLATAVATVLFVIVAALTIAQLRFSGTWVHYQ